MQYKTIVVYEYNKKVSSGWWRKRFGVISVYGTPFPIGTADLDNSYLAWLLSPIPRLQGVPS